MASVDDEEEYKATRKLNGLDKDIQVGEYVRTELGRIGKITEITNDYIFTDTEANCIAFKNCNHFFKDTFDKVVKKHSPNIIDLIEEGDYVNGMLVQKIAEPSLANDYKKLIYCNECEGLYEGIFDNNEIKSIVTHEQFNSVMYKVKE